jgi:hypothetical protein
VVLRVLALTRDSSGGFLGISSAKDLVDGVSVGIGFGVSFPNIKKLITAQPPSNRQQPILLYLLRILGSHSSSGTTFSTSRSKTSAGERYTVIC